MESRSQNTCIIIVYKVTVLYNNRSSCDDTGSSCAGPKASSSEVNDCARVLIMTSKLL